MILDSIVLHNFGVYAGRQTIDLAPPSKHEPVILFGGLNGGGKTTLLSALQLALFGRRSQVWRGEESNYDAYLEKMIHRQTDPEEGAGVELHFRQVSEGEEQEYSILRYWAKRGASVKESLDVLRNGELDRVASDHWADWVEDILPVRIAPLFFFDGEKIEELADPDQSTRMLRTAIQSLLGLDVIEQLQTDLQVFERRKRKEDLDEQVVKKLEALEAKVEQAARTVQSARQELAGANNEIGRLEKRLSQVSHKLEGEGGELFENRAEIEKSRAGLVAQRKTLEEQLRDQAAGALPFALVPSLLSEACLRAEAESTGVVAREIVEVLEDRDHEVLEAMRDAGVEVRQLSAMRGFLESDLERRKRAAAHAGGTLGLDSGAATRLVALHKHVLPTETARSASTLRQLDEHEAEVDILERKLAGVPEEDAIRPLLEARQKVSGELAMARRRRDALEELERQALQAAAAARRDLENEEKHHAQDVLRLEDSRRLLHHSSRARESLDGFREKILIRHVRRIERLVLESFQTLMRKQFLVHDIRIDPKEFKIELLSRDNGTIAPEALSAGERQLLAISLLWGLSRASGRPLPMVIDTPLGRLDSVHRRNLVERYFPVASHQVLVLSTDEEIDEEFFPLLEKHVGRSYTLEFDEDTQTTTVQTGYFF